MERTASKSGYILAVEIMGSIALASIFLRAVGFFGCDDEGTKRRELRITWHGCLPLPRLPKREIAKTPWDGRKGGSMGGAKVMQKMFSLGMVKRLPLDKSDLLVLGFPDWGIWSRDPHSHFYRKPFLRTTNDIP